MRHMFRAMASLFCGLYTTILLSGCTQSDPPLRVALLEWPPYELAFWANEQGWITEKDAQLLDYQTPAEVARAFANGTVDLVALTLDYALTLKETHPETRIITVIDYSNGADSVLSAMPINDRSDLIGKRIGLESGQLGSYMFARFLDTYNLSSDDFEIQYVDIPAQVDTWSQGELDLLITYEPSRSEVMQTGAVEVFNSSDIPKEIVDVFLIRESLLIDRGDQVRRFFDGWFRAVEDLHQNDTLLFEFIGERESLPAETIAGIFKEVEVPSLRENLAMLTGQDDEFVNGLTRNEAIMIESGLMKKLGEQIEPVYPPRIAKPAMIEPFRLRSILPVLIFSLLACSGLATIVIDYIDNRERVRSAQVDRLNGMANLVQARIETGLRFDNLNQIRSIVEQAQGDRFLIYVLVLNKQDEIFISNKRMLNGQSLLGLDDTDLGEYLSSNETLLGSNYISPQSKWLVYNNVISRQPIENALHNDVYRLVLAADISAKMSEVWFSTLSSYGRAFLVFIIISFVLWISLKRTMVEPIDELKLLAKNIAKREPLSSPKPQLTEEFLSLDTALRDMSMHLSQLEHSYQELYDKNPATFITVDHQKRLANINEYGLKTMGYSKVEILEKPAAHLYYEEDQPLFNQYLENILSGSDAIRHWELRRITENGQVFWTRDGARRLDVDGEPRILIVSQDISDLHKMSQRLSYQAAHDELTGLLNRAEFSRLLTMSLEKAQMQHVRHCVCYLDLDQFKIVNDVCGHVAGDALLKQIATLFTQCLRKDDILARIGGDEFALLLECCEPQKAIEIIQALRMTLDESRFNWGDKFFDVGISAGIAIVDQHTRNVQSVLSEADSACYTAKDTGRNRTIVFSNDNEETTQLLGEMRWVNQINQAIERGEDFELFFQRIIPLDTLEETPFKGEVLIRLWQDDQLVPPGAFLPAAERYNLASKLDTWVTRQTLRLLEEYQTVLHGGWRVSINLSAQTVSNGRHNQAILRELESHRGLCPHLCFELTETAAMANFANAKDFMNRIRKLGCEFSLDDFGSGFSSFGYLKKMPVDYVKIDGMFIRDLAQNSVDQALVESMNNIAHALNKKTIAEFVENASSVSRLRYLNVDYAQGYYFHKPEPLHALLIEMAAGQQSVSQ